MFRLLRPKLLASLLLIILGLLTACGGRPLLPTDGGESSSEVNSDGSFQDAFVPGQTGNWVLEQDELGSTAIVNEQLVVTVAAPNTLQYAALGDRVFGDFALEVDAWQRSGPVESSYGVLFRMEDGSQFYRFDVTGNGLFMIERHNSDGTWVRLVPEWTPTAALMQGLNTANRLKIIAAGSNLTFYANDVLLAQITDSTFSTGSIALDAGTFGGGNLQVSFDNLTITSDTPR